MKISGTTLMILGGLLLVGALAAALVNRYVTFDEDDINRATPGKPQFVEAEGRIACNAFKSPSDEVGDRICDDAGATSSARLQSGVLAFAALLALVGGLLVNRRTARGVRKDAGVQATPTRESEPG